MPSGVTERVPRLLLAVASGLFLLGPVLVDYPTLSRGKLWADGATYLAMAQSLAGEADLRYEGKDLSRFREAYDYGPHGLFLKKVGDRLYYAKSLVYPLAGAPFVWLLGGTRGLLFVNGMCLSLALWLGFWELRRRGLGEWRSLLVVAGLFLGSVLPLYVWWLTPEVFTFSLVVLGLVCWSRGQVVLAALLLGIAAYAKPPNVFLALPLLVEPLLSRGPGVMARVVESTRRGLVLSATVGLFFGLNFLFTGAFNYQGGERKTFYSRFPYESAEATFETGGIWMSTEHVGPLVAGEDEGKQDVKSGPLRSAEELRLSFFWNLAYFWIGRFGGVLPYFPAVVLGVLLFLLWGGRDRAGWLCLSTLVVSYVFFIWLIPDNWYGGGGTVGNRYFLNLLPLGLFILPRGREWLAAAVGGVLGLYLLAPVLASPIRHSLHPGEHATWPAFKTFPPELTMLNDLSVFTDPWRKKRPYNQAELSGGLPVPEGARPYDLYFLDDGTLGQESSFGKTGFWLRAGDRAEVVLSAFEAPRAVEVTVTGGPEGDIVTVNVGRHRRRLTVATLKSETARIEAGEGLPYYGRRLLRLRFNSRYGGGTGKDQRPLGSFITLSLQP